jgi:F-type H+-transporting ATPase subunit b
MLSDPTFYVLLAFILFFLGAGKPLYKALTGALDTQINKIETDLTQATTLREEAQILLNETKLKSHKATKVSEDIIAQARDITESLQAQAQAHLKSTILKKKQLAENRIQILFSQSEKEVRTALADAVLASVQKSMAAEKTDPRVESMITILQKGLRA